MKIINEWLADRPRLFGALAAGLATITIIATQIIDKVPLNCGVFFGLLFYPLFYFSAKRHSNNRNRKVR
jgi:hypothetical protein